MLAGLDRQAARGAWEEVGRADSDCLPLRIFFCRGIFDRCEMWCLPAASAPPTATLAVQVGID